MEISPVSMAQVQTGRDGRQYEVDGTPGEIAKQLKEIDPSLSVEYNEYGEYFVVIQSTPDGSEHCILRVPLNEFDGRVVKYIEPRAFEVRNGISIADRLEAEQRSKFRAREQAIEEAAGEKAYALMRTIQKDILGVNPRSFAK